MKSKRNRKTKTKKNCPIAVTLVWTSVWSGYMIESHPIIPFIPWLSTALWWCTASATAFKTATSSSTFMLCLEFPIIKDNQLSNGKRNFQDLCSHLRDIESVVSHRWLTKNGQFGTQLRWNYEKVIAVQSTSTEVCCPGVICKNIYEGTNKKHISTAKNNLNLSKYKIITLSKRHLLDH